MVVFVCISLLLWLMWGITLYSAISSVNEWLALTVGAVGGWAMMYLSVWSVAQALRGLNDSLPTDP